MKSFLRLLTNGHYNPPLIFAQSYWLIISHLSSNLRLPAKYSFLGQYLNRRHYKPTCLSPEGVYLLIAVTL